MSVQTQIDRIKTNVENSFAAVAAKGGTVPETQTSDNLSDAIMGIPASSGSYILSITFDPAFSGQPYTVTATGENYSGTVPTSLKEFVTVLYGGTQYTVASTSKNDGLEYSENVLTGSAFGQYAVALRERAHIYGVTWDGTATTKWARTDDAAGFTDPVPYVLGATEYGSPFDNLMPWKGMVKSERTAGTMVAIPKFWYQLTQNTEGTPSSGMTIKVADKPVPGYYTSPAHMYREDGYGERDVVYVGRYHCATSTYKSETGKLPQAKATRANFRTRIHALGENIWQMDFATRFTIWLLYLVEFADWNSQVCIGFGCGNGSSTGKMGYTDSMPYHTGTTQTDRNTYGLGTQYRNIEGLWDNVCDYTDGCYNSNAGMNIILNPNNFSDSRSGVSIGTPSNGFPTEFTALNTVGFPAFYDSKAGGSQAVASCDYREFSTTLPVVCIGGAYDHNNGGYGLFSIYSRQESNQTIHIGSRPMELPN